MRKRGRFVCLTPSLGSLVATGQRVRASARVPARDGTAGSHDSSAGRSAIFRKAVGVSPFLLGLSARAPSTCRGSKPKTGRLVLGYSAAETPAAVPRASGRRGSDVLGGD